jgi:hypothetical protein
MSAADKLTMDSGASLTTGVRLLVHLKENNLTYLLGTLIAMQMGLLQKATEYGSGICG